MAKTCNQKAKLFYIMEFLQKESDELHPISVKTMIAKLEANGITAARKSVYSDMETLRECGLDILYRKEPPEGYYLAQREFELPELKLLVDAVQGSRFITEKKSKTLIKKIEGLASSHEATKLQRQVFVSNRIKSMNESIYYNVDILHSAIASDVKIRFQYTEWTVEKKLQVKKQGAFYSVSPWALTWDNQNYYVIGYEEASEKLKHFRVDKMLHIEPTKEKRVGKEVFHEFDLPRYVKKTFGMFGGEEKSVLLRLQNHLAGVVIDRFGKDVYMRRESEEYFNARIDVVISPQFFGWLAGLGTEAEIVTPPEVKCAYVDYLKEIIKKQE